MITTTLNRIRAHNPCEDGWRKLLAGLGKTAPDDEPLPFARILEINGLIDAVWACRVEPGHAKTWRLFAVWCARQVEHLMKDERSRAALDVAERHANGQATDSELIDAARAAARSATNAAYAAYAADAAADAAVRAAARSAAARSAARSAAAVRAAARSAAARSAARSAAARSAAYAADAAADAAVRAAARSAAALDDAKRRQEEKFREMVS